MEDEECLPENSSLKEYLQNLGFSDLQITKNTWQNPSSVRFEVAKPKSKLPHVETIEEDVIEQISIVISTQMLFEEDISNVEKLLSSFKVVKNGVLKSMFKDLLGVVVIFLGLCLYWVIGYYAFFMVSSFYAFIAANYLTRKHSNRARLKKLTSILQANFMLLKKTVKFIEENKLIEANSALASNSGEFIEGFSFYKNFKSDFLLSINEIINILIQSTQKLIKKIPLYDYIENPEFYLCNNFNQNYDSANLSKLYEIYLLVQSEFLQRLILSLIPNIRLHTTNNFCELNKTLTETCVNLLRIKNKLSRKFKFLFLNGIHSPKNKVEFKLPLKSKPQDHYLSEFILNIHETSKTFQNLLLKCRILEENLVLDKIPNYVGEELAKIQADLNACQRNIADSFILLKKANTMSEDLCKSDVVGKQVEEEVKSSERTLNKIMVGYTDLDPKIEDEIFEAYFANENLGNNMSDIDDFNLEEILEKRLEREYCKNVMKELKLKLVEKAKYWKKREKELLRKKGIAAGNEDDSEVESSDEERVVNEVKMNKPLLQNYSVDKKMPLEYREPFSSSETNSEQEFESKKMSAETMLPNCQTQCNDFQTNQFVENNFETLEKGEITSPPTENSEAENIHESFIPEFNRGFLDDLNKARQRIFKSSAVEEELFGDSGEDSISEHSSG